jgi:hypothetical protein
MKPTYLVCAVLLAAGCGHKPVAPQDDKSQRAWDEPFVEGRRLGYLEGYEAAVQSSITGIPLEKGHRCDFVGVYADVLTVECERTWRRVEELEHDFPVHREAKPSVVHRLYACGEPIDPQANEICVSRHEVFGFGAPQNPQAKEDKP